MLRLVKDSESPRRAESPPISQAHWVVYTLVLLALAAAIAFAIMGYRFAELLFVIQSGALVYATELFNTGGTGTKCIRLWMIRIFPFLIVFIVGHALIMAFLSEG